MERIFELGLWSTRFFVLLPVIFGLLGAVVLFVVASIDVVEVVGMTFQYYFGHGEHHIDLHADAVGLIIGAVDLYLIAVVLLIFSFGLYELFISRIDVVEESSERSSGVLEIHSLDQLKDKLAKVIVMVLVVSFFQRVLHMKYDGPLEMLYFALSILVLSLGLYFLHKGGDHPIKDEESH